MSSRAVKVIVTITDPETSEVVEMFTTTTAEDMSTYKLGAAIRERVETGFDTEDE